LIISDNELEVGKKYDNLKVMCEVLGMKYKDGTNCRKALLKEIECYYRLTKKGRGYIVEEKYNVTLKKLDKRENNGGHLGKGNTKYDLLMDSLIINFLYENNLKSIDMSFNQLFGQDEDSEDFNIALLTTEYRYLLDIGYEQYAKEISIRKDLVDMYSEKLKKIISKCLETALDRLQKQNIIIWHKNIMIKYFDLQTEIADDNLMGEIKIKEKEVYEELDITPFQRRNIIINKRFKREVYKKLFHHMISSYWKVYSIEILDEEKIINIDNINEIKKEITSRFIKSIHKSLLNKKYSNKKNIPSGGIGNIRVYEYNPFDSMESLEDMNNLDEHFFVDYQKKDWIDIWEECLNEE